MHERAPAAEQLHDRDVIAVLVLVGQVPRRHVIPRVPARRHWHAGDEVGDARDLGLALHEQQPRPIQGGFDAPPSARRDPRPRAHAVTVRSPAVAPAVPGLTAGPGAGDDRLSVPCAGKEPDRTLGGSRMRRLFMLVLAGFSLMAAGCVQFITPTGPAPLRYRDDVFTAAQTSLTSDVTYGSATTQQGQVQTLKLDVYEPTTRHGHEPPRHRLDPRRFVRHAATSCRRRSSLEAQNFAAQGLRQRLHRLPARADRLLGRWRHPGLRTGDRWTHSTTPRRQCASFEPTPRSTASTRAASRSAGTSAGAITALHVAYNSEDPGTSGNAGWSSDVQAAVSLSGARFFGPIAPTDPPCLLFHGTADPLVPYQWAVNTVNQVTAAGVGCYLTTFEGQGHVPIGPNSGDGQNFQRVLDQTRNFLYLELDLAHAAQ